MPDAYSPSAQFTDSQTRFSDGDAGSAVVFNGPIEKLFDRCAHLRDATDGLLVWGHKASVTTGGAASGNTGVYVTPIESVTLFDGTTRKAFLLASETQLTTASHFGGVALSADTWYYVYAYVSGGALALQISLDAPEAGLIWKSGATGTHRYLFCFHTDSSGVALPMRMTRGRYLYRFSAITSTELRALNATSTAGSPTDIILARGGTSGRELLPPHSRVALLRSDFVLSGNSATDQGTASFYTNGDTTTATHRQVFYPQSSSYEQSQSFWIECDSSRKVDYTVTVANTDGGDPTFGSLNVFVLGFEE